jgi:hypothetical protein
MKKYNLDDLLSSVFNKSQKLSLTDCLFGIPKEKNLSRKINSITEIQTFITNMPMINREIDQIGIIIWLSFVLSRPSPDKKIDNQFIIDFELNAMNKFESLVYKILGGKNQIPKWLLNSALNPNKKDIERSNVYSNIESYSEFDWEHLNTAFTLFKFDNRAVNYNLPTFVDSNNRIRIQQLNSSMKKDSKNLFMKWRRLRTFHCDFLDFLANFLNYENINEEDWDLIKIYVNIVKKARGKLPEQYYDLQLNRLEHSFSKIDHQEKKFYFIEEKLSRGELYKNFSPISQHEAEDKLKTFFGHIGYKLDEIESNHTNVYQNLINSEAYYQRAINTRDFRNDFTGVVVSGIKCVEMLMAEILLNDHQGSSFYSRGRTYSVDLSQGWSGHVLGLYCIALRSLNNSRLLPLRSDIQTFKDRTRNLYLHKINIQTLSDLENVRKMLYVLIGKIEANL